MNWDRIINYPKDFFLECADWIERNSAKTAILWPLSVIIAAWAL